MISILSFTALPSLLALIVILGLAAFRVTRLLIEDEILDHPRNALFNRLALATRFHRPAQALATLLTCYWCLGFYVSILLTLLVFLVPYVGIPLATVLAVSALPGLLASTQR